MILDKIDLFLSEAACRWNNNEYVNSHGKEPSAVRKYGLWMIEIEGVDKPFEFQGKWTEAKKAAEAKAKELMKTKKMSSCVLKAMP